MDIFTILYLLAFVACIGGAFWIALGLGGTGKTSTVDRMKKRKARRGSK